MITDFGEGVYRGGGAAAWEEAKVAHYPLLSYNNWLW